MTIYLDTKKQCGYLKNFWSAVHFHPTDAIEDEWGQSIIKNIKKDKAAHFVRIYAMLEEIVGQDEQGNLTYDFTAHDKRVDFLVQQGFDLLICINFMPDAIAAFPGRDSGMVRYKGKRISNSVPRDYKLFEEVCFNYARHIYTRYGSRANSWLFHCWNEPDHEYWVNNTSCFDYQKSGARDKITEYLKLYKAFEHGFTRACIHFKIGGPSAAYCYDFVREFLAFVKSERLKFDFLSMHSYADLPYEGTAEEISPEKIACTVRNFRKMLEESGLSNKSIVVDEWGAAAGGFLSIEENPVMEMRENEFLPAFYFRLTDLLIRSAAPPEKMLLCLSGQHKSEFDFDGYRSIFTKSGFKKPIYNAFVLLARLKNIRLCCNEKGCIATKDENGNIALALYNGGENPKKQVSDKEVALTIDNIGGEYLLRESLIDKNHSNAYGYWKSIGAPRPISADISQDIEKNGEIYTREEKITIDKSFCLKRTLHQNSAYLAELIKL